MNILYWIIVIIFLGPLIGSLTGILIKPSKLFLCISFSFAAGVMLSISFLQLIPESLSIAPIPLVLTAFVAGFVVMYLVDITVPHFHTVANSKESDSFERTALTLFVGIAIHNFPEGFAVGISFSSMMTLGLLVAISISMHTVPETIIPVASYYSLFKIRKKAFIIGWLTTVPLLIGFFIGVVFFKDVIPELLAFAMAITAGIMVYLCGDELIPASQRLGYPHAANFSIAGGVAFVLILGLFL